MRPCTPSTRLLEAARLLSGIGMDDVADVLLAEAAATPDGLARLWLKRRLRAARRLMPGASRWRAACALAELWRELAPSEACIPGTPAGILNILRIEGHRPLGATSIYALLDHELD